MRGSKFLFSFQELPFLFFLFVIWNIAWKEGVQFWTTFQILLWIFKGGFTSQLLFSSLPTVHEKRGEKCSYLYQSADSSYFMIEDSDNWKHCHQRPVTLCAWETMKSWRKVFAAHEKRLHIGLSQSEVEKLYSSIPSPARTVYSSIPLLRREQ